jgi:DNA-binding transcriptional MerR regulator
MKHTDEETLIEQYQAGEYHRVHKLICEKQFTIKDVGVQHHIILHWDKEGLLFEQREFGKWRKFDLVEYVWIRMIMKLREYNLPLDIIREVRKCLIEPCFLDITNETEIQEEITKFSKVDGLEKQYSEAKNDPKLMDQMNAFPIKILEICILDVLLQKIQFSLLVNLQGELEIFKPSYFEESFTQEAFTSFIEKSFISISLTEILSDFIGRTKPMMSFSLAVLNDSERKILEASRKEGIKELTIRYNEVPSGSKTTHIEYTYEEFVEKGQRIEDIILKEGYQTITIKTQKGNIVNCTNTVKKKIVGLNKSAI